MPEKLSAETGVRGVRVGGSAVRLAAGEHPNAGGHGALGEEGAEGRVSEGPSKAELRGFWERRALRGNAGFPATCSHGAR